MSFFFFVIGGPSSIYWNGMRYPHSKHYHRYHRSALAATAGTAGGPQLEGIASPSKDLHGAVQVGGHIARSLAARAAKWNKNYSKLNGVYQEAQFIELICQRPTSREPPVFWLTALALPPLSCWTMHLQQDCDQPEYLLHQVAISTLCLVVPHGQEVHLLPGQFPYIVWDTKKERVDYSTGSLDISVVEGHSFPFLRRHFGGKGIAENAHNAAQQQSSKQQWSCHSSSSSLVVVVLLLGGSGSAWQWKIPFRWHVPLGVRKWRDVTWFDVTWGVWESLLFFGGVKGGAGWNK